MRHASRAVVGDPYRRIGDGLLEFAAVAKPILRILSPVIGAEEQLLVLGRSAITLGRGEDNDVVLLEQAASRDHARIDPVEGGYEIVDCNSAAGLVFKGRRVERHRLADGDEIKVGGTTLRYVESAQSEPTIVPTSGDATPPPPTWEPGPASGATEVPEPAAPAAAEDDAGMAATMLPEDTEALLTPPADAGSSDAAEAAPASSTQTEAAPVDAAPATDEATPADAAPSAAPSTEAEAAPAGTLAAAHVAAAAPAPLTPPEDAPDPDGYSLGTSPSSPSTSGYSLDGSGSAQEEALSLKGPKPSSASVYSLDGSGPAQREGLSLGTPDAPAGGLQLDGPAAASKSAASSGYALEGPPDTPFASVDIHEGGPSFAASPAKTSLGTYVLFVLVGAAAAFGILTALYGPPW